MPFIVPFLPLIAAGVSAAGIGTSIYEADKSSDANTAAQQANQQALLQQQQAQANQANLTKQEAVLGAQGQSQQQTGGSLTDSGTTALTDLLAGYPGYQNGSSSATGTAPSAAATTLGSGGDGSSTVASILSALQGGGATSGFSGANSITGGNWQSQPTQAQSQFELSNPILG
jgi:hypothetical protein